jgi:hypothetical protein
LSVAKPTWMDGDGQPQSASSQPHGKFKNKHIGDISLPSLTKPISIYSPAPFFLIRFSLSPRHTHKQVKEGEKPTQAGSPLQGNFQSSSSFCCPEAYSLLVPTTCSKRGRRERMNFYIYAIFVLAISFLGQADPKSAPFRRSHRKIRLCARVLQMRSCSI